MKSCHEDVSHLSMNNKIVCASVISLGIVFVLDFFYLVPFERGKKDRTMLMIHENFADVDEKTGGAGERKKAEVYNCTIEHTKTSACHLLERNWSAKSCTTFSRVHIQFSI